MVQQTWLLNPYVSLPLWRMGAFVTRSPMTRRFWLRFSAWIVACLALLRDRAAAQDQQATLNETLRSVLKCRRPQEFVYVDLVTQKVDQGILPRPLVLSMMTWARDRPQRVGKSSAHQQLEPGGKQYGLGAVRLVQVRM